MRTTRCAVRSLLMMSTCVARLAGVKMPTTGSGDLTSTSTVVVAVYFFGNNSATIMTVPAVARATSSISFQCARRMDKTCEGFMNTPLKQALVHIQDVVRQNRIVEV